jgi:hypothetical protein
MIDKKIEKYLTEASYVNAGEIDVEDFAQTVNRDFKGTLLKFQVVDCCNTCFYSLGKSTEDMTCENSEVGMVLTGEKYHGQYNMRITPEGKCKHWKEGRRGY